jgi:hypothetical protein
MVITMTVNRNIAGSVVQPTARFVDVEDASRAVSEFLASLAAENLRDRTDHCICAGEMHP